MLSVVQLYGFVFLLGSFSVAALSDARRMAAQRDFAEVWAAFTVVAFAYDVYSQATVSSMLLAVKWLLILVFAAYAHGTSHLFSISLMDVAAISAVSSLLAPPAIVAYWLLLFVFKEVLHPVLSGFGEGGAFPFLPVVLLCTLAVLGLEYAGVIDAVGGVL